MLRPALVLIIILGFCLPQGAKAEGKEFFTSVVYGTVAGALVGAATLAFSSDPGDNVMNIARGASLGLYTGIFLGLYLTYGVDDSPSGTTAPGDSSVPQGKLIHKHNENNLLYGVSVYPVVQRDSVGVGLNILRLTF